MNKLAKTLDNHSLSKSQVARMVTELDEHVESFRYRPLDRADAFSFVAPDPLTI